MSDSDGPALLTTAHGSAASGEAERDSGATRVGSGAIDVATDIPASGTTRWLAIAEPLTLALLLITAVLSAWFLTSAPATSLFSPIQVAGVLVANLLPAMALMVFAGRRLALRRAQKSRDGEARLHTRLVALFSVTAAVPTLLVAIFASVLFQAGVDLWFSDRSRGLFDSAVNVAENFFETEKRDVGANTIAIARDMRSELLRSDIGSRAFYEFYLQQVVVRELSESAIIEVGEDGQPRTLALIDPENRTAENRVPLATLRRLDAGSDVVTAETGDGVEAVTRLLPERRLYLFTARGPNLLGWADAARDARAVSSQYDDLFARSKQLQLRFIVALYLGSLLLVGMAVWSAIIIADRILRPIDELVAATSRVAAGDLAVRVREPARRGDEIGRLGSAFNVMTDRMGQQTRELLSANEQIENRRAFIEAVLSAVGSGVLSVDRDGRVRLVNGAATRILRVDEERLLGAMLNDFAPELSAWLASARDTPIVAAQLGGESKIWTATAVSGEDGYVVTFDDITVQLNDQRRAAWSDVARRIAHEIKNPLTPIQLAAERLQRRFAAGAGDGTETFTKLTSTIIRQVGDLRRMVDEFSNFARMPKPMFRDENLVDIIRQASFLHEVAHPAISFEIAVPDAGAHIVCDRRLLAQAFTNILKNAVEAIERKDNQTGSIVIDCGTADDAAVGGFRVSITDNGVGLPDDRERMMDPYVTMREGGTGLGLAIVKKIIDDHEGTLSFADAPDGGTRVVVYLPQQPGSAQRMEEAVDGA